MKETKIYKYMGWNNEGPVWKDSRNNLRFGFSNGRLWTEANHFYFPQMINAHKSAAYRLVK